MCGINGILHFDRSRHVDARVLARMRDAIAHRGPDDEGLYIDNNLGLGHRRLSILDVSAAGHQPFLSEDGRLAMVFNGEIYNFRDFYPELHAAGYTIRTGSDTEVLLKLFQMHGLDMLPRLNGMFAFAIWDRTEQKLTAVRDRMGVKPLYYSIFDEGFYFASEHKALFTAGVPLKISQDGMGEYIFNRFVAGENTLFENVNKLLPGHSMIVGADGKVTFHRWWNMKTQILSHRLIRDPKQWFEETFDRSVRLRMVSDVPVGVLLSGGLDSSSVVASLGQQGFKDIQTFNIGFRDKLHDESELARLVTKKFGYGFHTMHLEGEMLYDKLLTSSYLQDEPLTHLSEPHLLAVSQLAKPSVKVLLSGEGADELMGGYVRYKALQSPTLLHSLAVLGRFGMFAGTPRYEKLLRYSNVKSDEELIMYNGSNIFPEDIAQNFGIQDPPENAYRKRIYEDAKMLYPGNLRRQALYFDQHTYLCSLLDRNDRCTMGASIECREPFLDPELLAGLGSLEDKWLFTGKKGKFILKSSVEERLPQQILQFRKVGLSVPWGDYIVKSPAFKEELASFSNSELFRMPYFERIDPIKLIDCLRGGDIRMIPYIMPLFMLHIWLKSYVNTFSGVAEVI